MPRFPGTQPLIFDFTAGNGTSTGETEIKLSIDTFQVSSAQPVIVILDSPAPPAVTSTGFDRGASIVGGERDMSFTVEEGSTGGVFSCSASEGVFTIGTPNGGSGFVLLQYDGTDGSIDLDTVNGLGGLDLTLDGAIGFEIIAVVDVDSEFTITLVDNSGNEFTAGDVVPGTRGEEPISYFIFFADFPDAVDFSDIVAIEFLIEAFENVDFNLISFNTFGPIIEEFTNCYDGVVAPCDTDYYRLQDLTNVLPGDYLTISYSFLGEPSHADSGANFYLVGSKFDDLQTELATNEHIIDTLGALPGPYFYDYKCQTNCELEIVWSSLKNLTYYIAVEGTGPGLTTYEFCINRREVPITQIFDSVSLPVFRDRREDTPPEDFIRHYSHYLIDVPEARYSEGTYLVVNISRAEPFPGLKLTLMHESMAIASVETGVIGEVDYNSYGNQVDQHTYPYCVDVTLQEGNPYYENPARYNPRVPCECFTQIQTFGSGPAYQLTCNVTVDPCNFRYGEWYASVELPSRADPENSNDTTGYSNYTLTAYVVQPSITSLFRNVTFKGFVENTASTHYRLNVPASAYNDGDHLMVHVSNVRNGFVDIFVHKGDGLYNTLAGGPEGCSPANATCTTCDACNVIVEKCHFSPGSWYISVNVAYDESDNSFRIFDEDRVPITYTIRANWVSDPAPVRILSGVPVSKYIGEGLYDFYVLNIPPTVDTWLFVELYAKAEDTEVVIAMLHGELPGGDCYARPDFYCMTGDPYEKVWSTGPPTFYDNEPVQRESCSFMIQTCELEAGPLYISVYGHHKGYAVYEDTTFYQVPVHYTLWVDFDSSLPLVSGVSYSETVFEKQYQHYYIRADQVAEGSWLSVEVTNIQHGIPQTVEVYVNYNFLAGDCPCYDHLYNCTQDAACKGGFDGEPFALPDVESVLNCCTIVVPSSDFRPGVWYIAVLGVNEDLFQYTTPIGYTLTATIHDAPNFHPLLLGQEATLEVAQWNETYEYAHFKLAAEAIPDSDLIFKVTWVQNCEFRGKHDDSTDYLRLFVNINSPAGANPSGHKYWCETSVYEDSYCTIVVPNCEWQAGDRYFVAVQGDYSADFKARFTLLATLDEIRNYELSDNVPVYDRVGEGRYKHYFIHTNAEEDQYLEIDVYTNQDQDPISVYLNKDRRAGDAPCWDHTAVCSTHTMCSWQLLACELEPGRYFISVKGAEKQFYAISTEYTVLAAHRSVVTPLNSQFPVTGHLYQPGQVRHYLIEIDELVPGTHINFIVDNVKHGSVTAFLQFGFLSGRCPCFIHEKSCTAVSGASGESDTEWCEIRVPSCEVQIGTYYWSVWANELITPDPLIFLTPIGFTVEIDVWAPDIETPKVNVGRNTALTELYEVVYEDRYRHYGFTWTDEDVDAGYHLILEITDVRGGVLTVYYNPLFPGDVDPSCHLAQLCTSGLSSGRTCYWQLPYCLTEAVPTTEKHYISVHGESGRFYVFYKVLMWKQPVPVVIQNPTYTLDNATNANIFTATTELNVTHSKLVEPNGWTQFIKLSQVEARADSERGEMLELFFYRITNNPGEPIAFNVYVSPKEPAGAHGCCDETNPQEMASCQNAPCVQTADTTTQINNGPEVFSHTCSLGTGAGTNNGVPFFGQRCTVRVWPCEFNKYCFNETNDWYVSVVPLTSTDPASTGAGLSYSFQWRTRDIRIEDTQRTIGSLDITPIINTYEFSTVFSVPATTTENQGWRSFVIEWKEIDARLSIQTEFSSGSGVVYIQGDEFASATDSCYDYICTSDEDCAGANRFIVTECQSVYHTRYFITVRNTGAPQNNNLQVSFRITSTVNPSVVEIPSHPSRADPYIGNSTVSVYPNGISGVQPENYDFYFLTIDDDDLDNYQSWVVEVSRPGGTNDVGSLEVYMRFGAEAGNYGTSAVQGYYGTEVEGCHSWEYACSLPTTDSVCRWQIPSCSLIEGHWFLSIFNPDVNLNGIPSDLPDYQIVTYIDDAPIFIPLNSAVFVNSTNIDSEWPEYLQHYYVNVTVDDVAFDDRNDISGYWTRWLRFQVDNATGSVEMWVNYDGLAGPSDEYACLNSFVDKDCSLNCYSDVTPCEYDDAVFKLKSGVYYIAIRTTQSTGYHLSVQMLDNVYTVIPLTATIAGEGNRFGTNNDYYSYNVSSTELTANGDGFGNYHYVIDTAINGTVGVNDDLDDNQYIIINVTASVSTDSTDSMTIQVWRDDCTRFECALSGPESWCTIDALTLAPCSSKGGRFYFRAENPLGVPFKIELYKNQTTIQTLADEQILTEIIFPYEYQEYFYEATQVGQGATLTVTVCSICGEVEAWIRPDLPAGPSPDITGDSSSCSIDHCSIAPPTDTSFEEKPNNCCELFLDTCQYHQRGYYIGVRGVATTFPSTANPNLYLPARYNIEAKQTTVNFTEISFARCAKTVNYYEDWSDVPRQYTIDVETVNVGTQLKFSLRVPDQFHTAENQATLRLSFNRSVGYSDECQTEYFCGTTTACFFTLPYCVINSVGAGTRYYLWADAPRGSEVLVERWDPVIPFIQPNIQYHATINGPLDDSNVFDLPFRPNIQYYRFDLVPPAGDDNYYEKFFARVVVSDISGGDLSVTLNSGYQPLEAGTNCASDFSDNANCFELFGSCSLDVEYGVIKDAHSEWHPYPPTTFFLGVVGSSQNCELHSISYTVSVQTNWVITYYPIDETNCMHVEEGQYNFHRLQPREVENPQQSILRFTVNDFDESNELTVLLNDGHLATRFGNDFSVSDFNAISFDWFCGYDDLYVSVFGAEGDSDYRMRVEKVKVHVKELFDDSIYYADDDDDDACPHEHDFYAFRTARPLGHHEGSFFRVLVDSEFPTKVYVNKRTIAWGPCHDSGYGENDPRETGTTSVNVYDFCDFQDGTYYITVVSDGPYYIYTDIRDDAKNLTLGEIFRDGLEPAEYQVYLLEICKDWYEPDDRLVVEISDVQNGDVYAWIRHEGTPGMRTSESETESCALDSTLALYGPPGQSGYNYLLVNSCELLPGTYQILVRTSPHEGTPSRNLEKLVTYRIFPYLIDYQIEPVEIIANTIINDIVDLYTINRYDLQDSTKFINYYYFMPLMENDGFFEGVSHAVARLLNVEGGLLRLSVACGRLAIPDHAYIEGEIYGLSKDEEIDTHTHMQSTAHPFTYQRVIDSSTKSKYQPDECSGCADFCVDMTFDDIDVYTKDSSAAIWLPSCYLVWLDFFLAVEPITQFAQDRSITYDLAVKQTHDYILIQPDTNHLSKFTLNNWDYDFYYSISPEPQSMRWRVVVTGGEGVLVTVRNHRCPLQATWTKEVWCDAAYYDRPWMCDVEIPTRAAHPGDNAFFVSVYGRNATYSIAFWRGRENCHEFTGAGRNDGLDFCAGLVPYATWRWDNYHNLDNEARCFFEELYQSFRVQPCWTGVSAECNTTLQAFAFYESFHACDEKGFSVGTCRSSCEAVVYECANWFESVDLEHYNCTSSRYLDENARVCTGSDFFSDFAADTQTFLEQPELILYESKSAATSLAASFVFILALVFLAW